MCGPDCVAWAKVPLAVKNLVWMRNSSETPRIGRVVLLWAWLCVRVRSFQNVNATSQPREGDKYPEWWLVWTRSGCDGVGLFKKYDFPKIDTSTCDSHYYGPYEIPQKISYLYMKMWLFGWNFRISKTKWNYIFLIKLIKAHFSLLLKAIWGTSKKFRPLPCL